MTATIAELEERLNTSVPGMTSYEIARDVARDAIQLAKSAVRDAERYRWLRDNKKLYLGPIVGAGRRGPNSDSKGQRYIISSVSIGSASHDTETLDEAIDAAIQGQTK